MTNGNKLVIGLAIAAVGTLTALGSASASGHLSARDAGALNTMDAGSLSAWDASASSAYDAGALSTWDANVSSAYDAGTLSAWDASSNATAWDASAARETDLQYDAGVPPQAR